MLWSVHDKVTQEWSNAKHEPHLFYTFYMLPEDDFNDTSDNCEC